MIYTSYFIISIYECLYPLACSMQPNEKLFKKLQKTQKKIPKKISVSRDRIINAFNTTKQMIVVKTSQNIIRWTKAHTFLTTRIVDRKSLILIVCLSLWKKKESQRHNQFSYTASSVSMLFDFLLIVSHLHFFLGFLTNFKKKTVNQILSWR